MKVTIKETNERAELNYMSEGNIDCFAEWCNISNCDDFELVEDDETGEQNWFVDQVGYDWWVARIAEEESLNERIAELRETQDSDEIDQIIMDSADTEFNDSARCILHALNERFDG